jgi:hypothetical protein
MPPIASACGIARRDHRRPPRVEQRRQQPHGEVGARHRHHLRRIDAAERPRRRGLQRQDLRRLGQPVEGERHALDRPCPGGDTGRQVDPVSAPVSTPEHRTRRRHPPAMGAEGGEIAGVDHQ